MEKREIIWNIQSPPKVVKIKKGHKEIEQIENSKPVVGGCRERTKLLTQGDIFMTKTTNSELNFQI